MSLPNLTPTKSSTISPTKIKHGLESNDDESKLPGLVLLITDTLIEHYWATLRRNVRRKNTTERRKKRELGWDGIPPFWHQIDVTYMLYTFRKNLLKLWLNPSELDNKVMTWRRMAIRHYIIQ